LLGNHENILGKFLGRQVSSKCLAPLLCTTL